MEGSIVRQDDLDTLLHRAVRRDGAALEALVERFGGRVFGLLYRLTGSRDAAEDLMQETFLRVVRTIHEYRHAGRFEAWLFRIAANLGRDYGRRRRRHGPEASLDADADGTGDAEPVDPRSLAAGGPWGREELEQRVARCLAELPEADREVLVLRHFSDLPFREIAELLGVPLGTALARAHRAAERLRARLGDVGEVG